MYLFIKLLFGILLLLISQNCKKKCHGEPVTAETSNFNFNIVDKDTGKDIFLSNVYSIDSFKILDENQNKLLFEIRWDSSIVITPVLMYGVDDDAYINKKCKNYYLKFNFNDIDTLTLCFRAGYSECKSFRFEEFEAYYNGKLNFIANEPRAGYPVTHLELIIFKK